MTEYTPTEDDLLRGWVSSSLSNPNRIEGAKEVKRAIARIKAEARVEALQDAQQIITGDGWVDEMRFRDGDRASIGYLIRELDEEVREGEGDD
jgi:hypothetical protein